MKSAGRLNEVRRAVPTWQVYLPAALQDMAASMALFIAAVRLAHAGHSASVVAGSLTIWSVVYLVASPLVGRRLTPGNSVPIMLTSCAGMAALGVALALVDGGVLTLYALLAAGGAAASLFFAPFQIFMKAVHAAEEKSLAYSTGTYTFAWSMGYAAGPFVAGFLMELGPANGSGTGLHGWRYAYGVMALAALTAGALVAWLGRRRQAGGSPTPAGAPVFQAAPPPSRAAPPDLAWLGWVGAGVGVVALSVVRGVFPARAVRALGFSDAQQGTVFFVSSVAQALTGLALARSRLWMYRAGPVGIFGLVGAAGVAGFGFLAGLPALLAAAIGLGCYCGAFFFYLVFHALSHTSRAPRYVGINEAVVGAAGIVGPMLGGALSDSAGYPAAFGLTAILVVAATAFQALVHRRNPVSPD